MHPDTAVSSKAMSIMYSFVNDIFEPGVIMSCSLQQVLQQVQANVHQYEMNVLGIF